MRVREVTLRYFDGCPNWKIADQRIHEALRNTGLADSVAVTHECVATAQEAQHLAFIGSPTILIDGVDPWNPGGQPAGLSCRIYRTDDGPQGSPTVDELVRVLSSNH